jgi:hypothetical protein
MIYFKNFPKVEYQFPNGNVLNSTYIFFVPEISIFDFQEINSSGIEYTVEDGKSPEIISKEIYGTSQLFWVVLLQNNIIDFYNEWPISYHDWQKELATVNSAFTFYTRYKMDIQENDIVAKYEPTLPAFFDDNNYGIVTSYDSFLRSFDVKMIKGDIRQDDSYIILRKNNNSYRIIRPIPEQIHQALVKRSNKLEAAIAFEKYDSLTQKKISVSPYYSVTDETLLSDEVDDIFTIPNAVLALYMSSNLNLYSEISQISFKQQMEKDFLFNRKVKTVPPNLLNRVGNRYTKTLARESSIIQ